MKRIKPKPTAPRKNGLMVLVVEDDQDNRDAVTTLLEGEGYDVVSADDGKRAIEQMGSGWRPNAILLGLRMHQVNGWEFRRELGRVPSCSKTPIILMCGGNLGPQDLAGCAAWISKPVHAQDLLRKLKLVTRLSASTL